MKYQSIDNNINQNTSLNNTYKNDHKRAFKKKDIRLQKALRN